MMQSKFYYYEYIPKLIGIKTNVKGFRWGFGKCDSSVSESTYNQCKVKIVLEEKSDNKVFEDIETESYCNSFRHFKSSPNSHSVLYDQTIGYIIHLRYVLSLYENTVKVVVGKSYLQFAKIKIMNIHPIAYILFDVVSLILLKNGLSTLYCSAVQLLDGRTAVFMAPPNTGKSLTVLKLRKDYNANIIAEDMAVTDGLHIWGAPHTNLYRNYHDRSLLNIDNEIIQENLNSVNLITILQKGNKGFGQEIENYFEHLLLLNHYSLGYFYSPCVRVLNYFNDDFSIQAAEEEEKTILRRLQDNAKGFIIEDSNPMQFSDRFYSMID